MPNPTQISLLDYHFEAKACNALLTAMLNHSDIDYATVDDRLLQTSTVCYAAICRKRTRYLPAAYIVMPETTCSDH